ncbi:NAD(P)H-binding protein [Pantoea sp. Mb-10]|uniref:NAD-dependent epimerase/dehydratase family protein n=1 Tax=unclassified Pantoea TaxID=2630326 RepID=UPI001E546B86|nr:MULTISPECIES: NAD-dependent epimerase/dehydratase family protein [unclassified Pantoea]MCE0490851.1 NAD(P)H-binding protein [Pantoea sp. Mb-10]MCE0499991.1 NAD(P)H-binding protein [Pantoea sp. Pb-8]
MKSKNKVLILGATGGIGGEIARKLIREKWDVCALRRNAPQNEEEGDITWMQGDALKGEQVMAAASGCSVIVHAVNPPGYRNWEHWVLPMLQNTIDAAERNGALIVLPGTVYNYGPDAFPLLREQSPQHPVTRKGAIRVEMERALFAWTQRGGSVLILRAGDFFGPQAGNNWFSQGLIKPGLPPRIIRNPGKAGTGHQWAYLPDVAETLVALLARREQLDPFACFQMRGHWDADGSMMAGAIKRVAQRAGINARVTSFPWWLITAMAPFNATLYEMLEMRYLWQQAIQMDNAKLIDFLGHEPHTPLIEAVRTTLIGQGCIH